MQATHTPKGNRRRPETVHCTSISSSAEIKPKNDLNFIFYSISNGNYCFCFSVSQLQDNSPMFCLSSTNPKGTLVGHHNPTQEVIGGC